MLGKFKQSSGPKSQSEILNSLIRVTKNLISSVEGENKLLEDGKILNLEPVLEKKVAHMKEFNDLHGEVREFIKNNKVNKADPYLLKLIEFFDKLEEVNRKNEILLRTNIEVSNKIVEMYKASKTESTIKQYGYNEKGGIRISKELDKVMPSITFSDKI